MNTIQQLQNWYKSECNADWEHQYGVKIETLDNPGWSVTIDLEDTHLEDKFFKEVSYGVGEESVPDDNNWVLCRVVDKSFQGRGGPDKLEEIIHNFLKWSKLKSEPVN
jgi:hypothetical protein